MHRETQNTTPRPDDGEQLVARHLEGDPEAFGELVARFGPLVWGLTGRYGLRREERDDVFQEVFLRLHRGAELYRPGRPVKPWVIAIAVNTTRSWMSRGRSRNFVVAERVEERRIAPDPDPRQVAEAAETLDFLAEELDRLPLERREVVLLCAVHQLPMAEVASILELPVGTVKTHLRKGRLALARALERRAAIEKREVAR
jgi:RNA polymerase sigma-70 factor, ECF subfamily